MPWLGLGVYLVKDGTEVEQIIKTATNLGYRSIDTTSLYDIERAIVPSRLG